MRLIADIHISPRTVQELIKSGHDVLRVNEVLSFTATDEEIVVKAIEDDRTNLTQDLDFSSIIALAGKRRPSLISLRLASSRIEYVSDLLCKVLPSLETQTKEGAIIAIEDQRIRSRPLPLS